MDGAPQDSASPPPAEGGPSSSKTIALACGLAFGLLALACIFAVICRRRRRRMNARNDHLRAKPWDTMTPVMTTKDDLGTTGVSMLEDGKRSYMFVSDNHSAAPAAPTQLQWHTRSSNFYAVEKPKPVKNDIILLEDDDMVLLQSHRGPPTLPNTGVVLKPPQPARVSAEDHGESGDFVSLGLKTTANSMEGETDGWNTNLSFVSEMSQMDIHNGDRISTISFTSLDDSDDIAEAKI
ncbi:hypothetical protein Ae201684P_011031 [Aphanomyces euteiches]|uniref:Uncharacterized protein n=2 Tax=Aphanomyces euteiches TaxID=100861 RepID=A0A6G0XY43_9STRA|nr:hypothetical protein Ae201684_000414 [Aphanomyces euteiches]KAH9091486.1 hypothetical protein Ae201684P_011031 [Aphanomyces euteiches]KAH9153092.1 hypothetical protein AeRB84_004589 [Aphanomyces euteiches]